MLTLYIAMTLMLFTALLLIAAPFLKNKLFFSKGFFAVMACALSFICTLYYQSNQTHEYHEWLAQGKAHYDLMVAFNALGGIDGTIARIKQKLRENPNDRQGWEILGKLYLAKGDKHAAENALAKAHKFDLQYSPPDAS